MRSLLKIRITSAVLTIFVSAVFPMNLIHAANDKPLPMKGRGAGMITGLTPGPGGLEITATGSGVATHLGNFTREERITLDPGTGSISGTIVFVAANGDTLTCSFAGGFTAPTTAAGVYTFTGGTGRFANAAGEAYFTIVQTDLANFTFDFRGTIDMR